MSSVGFSEVDSPHRIGPRAKAAMARLMAPSTVRCAARRTRQGRIARALIDTRSPALAEQREVARDEDEVEKEDEDGERIGLAEAEFDEAEPVQGEAHRLRRAVRPAAGQDEGERQDVDEVDQEPDDGDQDREPHQRQRDAAEAVDRSGAVDPGGIVELRRDALQPGEQHDHREGAIPPDGVEDERCHRRPGISQDREVAEAERPQGDAHDAGVLREDPTQQQRADEHRDYVRHQGNGAHCDAPAGVALEMQRERHPDGHREKEREGREDGGRGKTARAPSAR